MELIGLQQITADDAVQVEFLTVNNATDLYSFAKDDLLLVKRQLTKQDAQWLLSFKGHREVFTMQPESIEAFDAGNEIGINIIGTIGLCLLHTDDTLYIFDGDIGKSETPNVVRLKPVRRKEIGTYISVDEEVIGKAEIPNASEHQCEKAENAELSLLRKKICEYFSSHFTEIRVEFSGTSPENRTISLSSFYEKYDIESGRLRGSWSLFEKNIRTEILDTGVVSKAKEAELKLLSVTIPRYGRIIRSDDLNLLREKMEQIEKDYRAYLDGKTECKKVGVVAVKKKFSPEAVINNSFSSLEVYLHRLGEELNAGSKSHEAVQKFIFNEQQKLKPFSEHVKLQIMSSTYTERQWEEEDFVDRVWKAVLENPDFFGDEFIRLLGRYGTLLSDR